MVRDASLSPSWIVVGLGNPRSDYGQTRHNVGFRVLDQLLRRASGEGVTVRSVPGVLEWAQASLGGRDALLLWPMTYMNRSGQALAWARDRVDLDPGRLLVVHDDVDLPLGRIRLKRGGGDGGHNGIRDVVAHLGTPAFCRLRLGVGRPEARGDLVQWVLGPFLDAEQEPLREALDRAVAAAIALLQEGYPKAASRFNAKPPPEPGPTDHAANQGPDTTRAGPWGTTGGASSPSSTRWAENRGRDEPLKGETPGEAPPEDST